MAFTNPPLITLVADNLVRLSSNGDNALGLAAASQATIGLFGSTQGSDVILPEAFKANLYANGLQVGVNLEASVQVACEVASGPDPAPLLTIEKAGGDSVAGFEITISNTDSGEGADVVFESIYIRFH